HEHERREDRRPAGRGPAAAGPQARKAAGRGPGATAPSGAENLHRRSHSCRQAERGANQMNVRVHFLSRLAFAAPVGATVVCLMTASLAAQKAPSSPLSQALASRTGNAVSASTAAAAATDASGFERVVLTVGRSTVLTTRFDVTRIAVTNPAVADALVV